MASGNARALVCMRCGSERIRHQTRAEGLWPAGGEGVAWVCDACHHIGAPFVLEDQEQAGRDAELWAAEWDAAAFAVDEAAWQEATEPTRRPVLGTLLVLLAAMFLLPALYALLRGAASGSFFFVLWGLVGSGWLIAIGSALGVVGLRMLRPAPDGPTETPSGAPGDPATPQGPGAHDDETLPGRSRTPD